MTPQTWFITGASSGLGVAMALAALKAGHTVFATARTPSKAARDHPDIEALGGTWIPLDVTDRNISTIIQDLVKQHGPIDVVVNNAGYSLLGGIEDMSEQEMQQQIDTNLFGPIRVLKGVLPHMRSRRSGTIVNISSGAGLVGAPSTALYSASKFALEGLTESLAAELKEFGIRMMLVEPGGRRTQFLSAFVKPTAGLNADYHGTALGKALARYDTAHGTQRGDPAKAAAIIVDAVYEQGRCAESAKCLRLILGSDCYAIAKNKVKSFQDTLDLMEDIAPRTDF
ncbi:hypothetical protein ASPCADRAFT_505072 [Aspergillus carbonarius ITEM 5010]|uniref:Uncharacterized protein n=1 Tax=Aspergillus carbonarius (strain ITEM 5010) TaxID=602072 RepID=A0A1R3RU90_ASPC5|nr:hypothetical protein ASPCADRAFT_505072 [Aspergillus carbonarius ITEM 5010]